MEREVQRFLLPSSTAAEKQSNPEKGLLNRVQVSGPQTRLTIVG